MDKYDQQWSYVEKAISWAAKYEIGVLIDFHGAEGSQNGWGHAGIEQKATFLDRKATQDHTVTVLEWVAQKIKDKDNVVGLQLLNEPHPDDLKRYNAWYESTLPRLRSILGDNFPFYIGGSISVQARMDWIRQQPGFIVMDYHLYPVFDGRYKKKTAKDRTSMIDKQYTPLLDGVKGINLIIGEWACTLASTKPDWAGERAFCDAQMQLLNRPSIGGIHYWSYKTQGDYFNSWSFLLSSGGSDGLANRGGDDRPLLIPVNGESTFAPQDMTDLSTKGSIDRTAIPESKQSKRDQFVDDEPDAAHIWDEGCRTANEFAVHGSKLGFSHEWIRRESLSSEKHSADDYHRHFSRGLNDCEA